MSHKKYLSAKEIDELMNAPSDEEEEDETTKQIKNATNIDIIALPPPKTDGLTDDEDIDDERIQQYGDGFPSEVAGEIEIECDQADDNVEQGNMNASGDIMDMDIVYEEIDVPVVDVNQPSTSSNVQQQSEPPFKYNQPKWNKRDYEFSKTPVDVSYGKIKVLYEALGNPIAFPFLLFSIRSLILSILCIYSIGEMNPIQLLEYFIDDEVIQLITDSTNHYAHVDKNDPTFQTDSNEIRKFIGILFYTGIHTLSMTKLYWSDNPIFGQKIIRDTMSRDRFDRIKQYFHVCFPYMPLIFN